MIIKRRKILIFVVLATLAGGGFLAWRTLGRDGEEPTYTTAQVERGNIISTISGSGNLTPTNTFAVTTEVTGVVKEVFVKDQEVVEKGQKLVEITPDQDSEEASTKAWSTYLAAKNSLTSAEQNKLTLEKGVKDAESKLITAQQDFNGDWGSTEYWDAERRKRWSDLKSAEMALELAQQKYERADEAIEKAKVDLNSAWLSYQITLPIITAPVSGKVLGFSIVPGMVLSSLNSADQTSSSQKLLTVVGEQRPLVSVPVNEIDIPKIVTGQKVTLTFDALPDKTFTGKVVGVDRSGSQTQGVVTYPVLIQLDTASEHLYPNMTATAEIIIEAKDSVLWVPPSAIRNQAGQTVVRVLVSGKVQEKQVEVGLETADRAEITDGLSEGDVVVVSEQAVGGEAPAFGGQGGFMRIMR